MLIPPQPNNVGDIAEEPIAPSAPNNKQVKISNLKRVNKRQNKKIKGLAAGKKEAEQRLSSSETNTRQIKKDANKKVSALEKKLESSVQREHKTAISGEKNISDVRMEERGKSLMMHQALLHCINISKDASIDDLVDRLLVGLLQSAKHEGQTRSKILKQIRLRIEHHANISDKENAEKQLPQMQLSHKEVRENAARLLNKRLPDNIDNMDWKDTANLQGYRQ